MRSHLEQGTHVTVCQIEEEVFVIWYFSNWRKKTLTKNVKTSSNSKMIKIRFMYIVWLQ